MYLTAATDDWATDLPHVACPRGCGELSDQCACTPRAAVTPQEEPYDDYDDYRAPCRWSRCTEDAWTGGYCDVHASTL